MINQKLPSRLYQGYIFDLDGTLYLGNSLLLGAAYTIKALRAAGCKVAFVSNNPTYTREQIADKLNRLGIPVYPQDVVHSSFVLVNYLQKRAPECRVFPIGEKALQDELIAGGFEIVRDPQKIDFVIASFDRNFNYDKLQIAFDAVRAGAHLIATNADRFCPVKGGGQPDAAAVIAAIEACTNTKVEVVVGKPSSIMARAALEVIDLPSDQVLIIGDRLETDIVMGKQAGIATALVLTGATKFEDLRPEGICPDYVLDCIDQLVV
jgi:phosphoglycolate/pyridoxal phosphate phosphatase family enzyme